MVEPGCNILEQSTYQTIHNALGHKYFIYAVAALCVFIDNMLYTIVIPALPSYQKTYGVSQTWIGVFTAACPAAVCVCAPIVGFSVDRIGAKKTMVAGSVALGVGTAVYALAQSFWVLFFARILQGAAASITWTAGVALIPMVISSDEQGKYTGNLMAGAGIGALAGPVISGALISWAGLSAPFLFASILVFIQIVGVLLMDLKENTDSENKEEILTLVKDIGVVGISLANFSSGFMFALIEPIITLHLHSKFGMSTFWIGMTIGAMMVAFTGGAPFVGWLTDSKFPERKAEILILGITVRALIYPLLPVVQTAWLTVVILVMAGFFSSCSTVVSPVVNDIVAARYNGRLYGAGSAITTFLWNLGAILGPLLGSVFAENFGILVMFIGQTVMIFLVVILPFLVILVTMRDMLSPKKRKKEEIGETEKILREKNEAEILRETNEAEILFSL